MPAVTMDLSRLQAACAQARGMLLAARTPAGLWTGELSSSALSTATALGALALLEKMHGDSPGIPPAGGAIAAGLAWLAEHVNVDGGWGDTVHSVSNVSTTALVWAAFGMVPGADERYRAAVAGAEQWLRQYAGGLSPDHLADVIIARYGRDRTFSVPILTMCALSGRFGTGPAAWRRVIPLPFELASLPAKLFATLRLPVVSYALPALIAIGQVRHHQAPSRNPVVRWLRQRCRAKTLRVLQHIQPSHGGFLEATPLTSFVTMSLAGSGEGAHDVVRRGRAFLLHSIRPDGSWPIDTNLATWVTTLAVNGLGPSFPEAPGGPGRGRVLEALLGQQYRTVHPYTLALPGAWAWTDLPGGVPDADDTAGALLALHQLSEGRSGGVRDARVVAAAAAGVTWLLNLQNGDGGIPTFCRGWTKLPFDRSGPDLTAHAVRAWVAWQGEMPPEVAVRLGKALSRSVRYLVRTQSQEGAWVPLWFGNQQATEELNPTYGTARVLQALAGLSAGAYPGLDPSRLRAQRWLVSVQNPDGGWGGSAGVPSSTEETALVVEALSGLQEGWAPEVEQAWARGVAWLVQRVEQGTWLQPSPIGFYFAKLWYYEKLYPVVFSVAALEAAGRRLVRRPVMTA